MGWKLVMWYKEWRNWQYFDLLDIDGRITKNTMQNQISSLPNDNILALNNLKAFADEKIIVIHGNHSNWIFLLGRVENIFSKAFFFRGVQARIQISFWGGGGVPPKTHSSYYMILWFPDFNGCKPFTRKVNVSSSNHEDVSTFRTFFLNLWLYFT